MEKYVAGTQEETYPNEDGQGTDVVDVDLANTYVQMTSAETIGALKMTANAVLSLNAPLTISQSALWDNANSVLSAGLISQGSDTNDGPITLAAGTFTWSGGDFNNGNNHKSSFTVSSGAELDVTNTGGVNLQDDLTNNGVIKLANTASVTLKSWTSPRMVDTQLRV